MDLDMKVGGRVEGVWGGGGGGERVTRSRGCAGNQVARTNLQQLIDLGVKVGMLVGPRVDGQQSCEAPPSTPIRLAPRSTQCRLASQACHDASAPQPPSCPPPCRIDAGPRDGVHAVLRQQQGDGRVQVGRELHGAPWCCMAPHSATWRRMAPRVSWAWRGMAPHGAGLFDPLQPACLPATGSGRAASGWSTLLASPTNISAARVSDLTPHATDASLTPGSGRAASGRSTSRASPTTSARCT